MAHDNINTEAFDSEPANMPADQGLLAISRIKDSMPEAGYQGLSDLILLLEEAQIAYTQQPDQTDNLPAEDRVIMLDEILELAEQHIQTPLEADLIDDFLFGVVEFCTEALLPEEDVAILKSLLLDDSGHQGIQAVSAITVDTEVTALPKIEIYRNQLQQFSDLSETKGLTAVQDILLVLNDWFVMVEQQEYTCTHVDQAGLESITAALTDYFTLNAVDSAVDKLFGGLLQLSGEPLILDEDIAELKQLLLEEINNQQPEFQAEPEQVDEQPLESNTQEATDPIPEHLKEFVELLRLTLQQVAEPLNGYLAILVQSRSNQKVRRALAEDLLDEINKFASVAEIAGFVGLKQSCEHVAQNIASLKQQKYKLSETQIEVWKQWHEVIDSYLNAPIDKEMIQDVLIMHCAPDWLSALSENKTAELLINLKDLAMTDAEAEQQQRQVEATDEDVSLALPDDVYPELLEGLLQELPELTEQFSESVQFLSRGGRQDDINTAQRIAHTLKGAGNTVGVKGVANLTHHLEDILTALTDAKVLPGPVIVNVLLRASDCLEEMSEALTNNGSAPADAKQVLQEILDLAGNIDEQGVENYQATVDSGGQSDSTVKVFEEKRNITSKPSQVRQENTPQEIAEQQIRVPVAIIDKLLQFSNETTIINGQLREQLRQAGQKTKVLQEQLKLMAELGLELEELVDIRNYDLFKGTSGNTASTDFDALEMDQYNELHTCSRRIHEVTTDIRQMGADYKDELQAIDNLLMEQGQLNDSSQGDLLTLRMLPVKSIIPRIQRSLRQACRMTGKDIDLRVTGDNVFMDKDILNGMIDPLMHLIRNSVDHGIESLEQRISAGKSETGIIDMVFRGEGNMIVIECRDDGAGLNLKAIRNKAIERGIIEADQAVSEDELKQLIFQPNFSTSDTVTQVSGRGVGMDAVVASIRALGGTLSLDSEPGQGCVFNIKLPLSLVHYHSLLVKIGPQYLALAERSIDQILPSSAGTFSTIDDQMTFAYEDETYQVKTLDSLMTGVEPSNDISLEKRNIILVQQQQTKYAILIEEIIGVKELVVKGLGQFMPNIHGVIGASILDDGSIAAVLDVQELLEKSSLWSEIDLTQLGQSKTDNLPSALVVDDSLSARRSLEQFVGDLGFSVMAARDGQEAIEMIQNRVPDIVLTDMEMPRVNGIELTEFIRANADTKKTPVVMITSRSTSKHKLLATSKGVDKYITKPYSEDELTETIMEQVNLSQELNQPLLA